MTTAGLLYVLSSHEMFAEVFLGICLVLLKALLETHGLVVVCIRPMLCRRFEDRAMKRTEVLLAPADDVLGRKSSDLVVDTAF